jgi:hypothetical protein
MKKSLYDLSWQVDENTYRSNPAISYSALSTFAREGHTKVPTLWEKKDSEALRFGGLVDTLLTEPEKVEEKYFVADFPSVSDAVLTIVRDSFAMYGQEHRSLDKIPSEGLLDIINTNKYASNWLPQTRINDIIKKGKEYYDLLFLSGDKMIVSSQDYTTATSCVDTLKTHPYTKNFLSVNPFNEDIEGFYQLKFLLEKDENLVRPVRCMFDRIIVDHKRKIIIPCDLKTTGKPEYKFDESFLQWRYDLQATLYSYILFKILASDDYYKDFKIYPFMFIVVNRYNLTPLVWKFKDNLTVSDWVSADGVKHKGWRTLLQELDWYLKNEKYEYPIEAYANQGVMTLNNLIQV